MRSEPYHDELHTFRGDTEQRRHRRNGGSSCAMDERRCRHDMMMIRWTCIVPSHLSLLFLNSVHCLVIPIMLLGMCALALHLQFLYSQSSYLQISWYWLHPSGRFHFCHCRKQCQLGIVFFYFFAYGFPPFCRVDIFIRILVSSRFCFGYHRVALLFASLNSYLHHIWFVESDLKVNII